VTFRDVVLRLRAPTAPRRVERELHDELAFHIERRVETTAGDVSYAFRTFRRAPLPALTIVATAALGLGLASTAVEARCRSRHGSFFDLLGVRPALGRALRRDDDGPSSGRAVIVLSDRGWKKLFAGDPSAIGRRVIVNGAAHEIVGVMPDDFRGLGITQ
jgi:hypothetical protein